jgi:transcriptional regulator with PAS, ATPase and Fis domain
MQRHYALIPPPEEINLFEFKKRGIIANSREMKEVFKLARKVAGTECTVLILGESGVGKEVVAKIIHENSPVRSGPFVKVNCGAIPETLLESEMFGYAPGAFTGAKKEGKAGKFEMAENGTILLDEVGDLPLSLQVKLLHALEEKEVTRIGSINPQKINARIIAATNKDLNSLVKLGEFRKDLFYRLNVVPVYIPPLRERREDIMPLIIAFKKIFEAKYNIRRNCSSQVTGLFCSHNWPGNVRELKNIIERIYIISDPDELITPEVLVKDYFSMASGFQYDESVIITRPGILKDIKEEAGRQLIKLAVKNTKTLQEAAKLIHVDKATMSRKVKKYKISLVK